MAQNTARQTRLIGERVRALATILLTRRDDVAIREVTEDFGLDLIVTLLSEGKSGLRQFGVALRGVGSKVTAENAGAVLRPSIRSIARHGPFPFPVVLFLYTMENGEGWYAWANEPATTRGGGFELRVNQNASCQPLDDSAIDDIVAQVDSWYDAFYARTSPREPSER